MEEDNLHDGSLDLQELRSQVKELEFIHRNRNESSSPSDSETLVQDFALQFQPKVKEIVEEYIDVDLLDVEDSEAYLEYLRKELHSVESESAKVSEEIERLSKSHAQDSSRLDRDLEGLLLSLDSISSQDVEKLKENPPSSSSMEICDVNDDEKFKVFELETQMEEKRMILKSLEELDSLRKRFDAEEQVEDALTGLKVLEFDENFIRLQLRTYIPKLDNLLGHHKFEHTTEPSELIHELLIYLKDKTTEITKCEMFPNDVYIGDIIEAADSFRQVRLHSVVLDTRSSVQWVVAKVQDRIISTTLRKYIVKSSKTIRHTFEYYDRDETIVAHIAGGIDAFLKVSDGWPLLNTPLKLASLKNSDNQSKGISLSLICKVEVRPCFSKLYCKVIKSVRGFLHSLPEAVTISCLARVSRLDHAALSLVSKSYRSMVVSSDLYQTRSLMGYAEKFIYVCLTIPPDSTPSWFILRPTLDVATGNTVNRANPIPSSPSQPREGFSVVALDWGIYVIGGWVNGKRTSGVLVLDCRSHKWYHVTSTRVSAEARVVDGKIYVMGGCSKEKRDSDWGEVFDPKTQTWAYLPISKPMVESTSPIMSLIHGNVIRRCYYLPSQSKWKRKKQTNRTNKFWPHDRKPTYCKDWCVTNKLIYTCGNDGGIYWCEAKDLDQCETVGTIGWKKVLGTLGLLILEESLFHSRAVYFGGKMIKMWESYKIMYNISKNLDELLPGTNLTNNGQNIMVFWEKNADVRGNKRLQIWCAEISLERQSCGEVWGDCEWIKSVLVVDLVTVVDPFLYNSKVLCSIPVDV